ncbi:hypothetical protein PVAND_015532 [Polypedilum vanderplanki]|uniref:Serpin domain-containing protein n=1 Tax=Polypedilum vanderplanki TaxID=319348 RepID=A0A9J6BCF5_POLVA|nr:hypothetical protein PVAND_015532 [Polypedilum vanderplanki]
MEKCFVMNVTGSNYLNNAILSPISIDISLSILLIGSSGLTFKQLLTGLKYPTNYSINLIQSNSFLLIKSMKKAGGIEYATKIYVNEKFSLQNVYKSAIQKYFHSGIETMNFSDRQKSANTINDFISTSTNGMIENMLKESDINLDSSFILINCIYFKGIWVNQFNKNKTTEDDFMVNETYSIKIPFMKTKAKFKFGFINELNGSSVIELPYANSNLTLTIVLPSKDIDLNNLIQLSKNYDWKNLSNRLRNQTLSVEIPKFNATINQFLNRPLIKMGMDSLFDSSTAQLNHIVHNNGTPIRVTLDYLYHQAVINIDEEGTTAAATTAASSRSMPITFLATKPFLYLLRTSSTIYFIGHFTGKN